MKLSSIFIFLLFFFSCKKNEFQTCENFSKIVGTWKDIDTDTGGDLLIIKENGKIISHHNMERTFRFKSISCEYKKGSVDYYFIFWDNSEGGHIVFHTSVLFDTLRTGGGAFNHSQDDILYDRRYIKIE